MSFDESDKEMRSQEVESSDSDATNSAQTKYVIANTPENRPNLTIEAVPLATINGIVVLFSCI